MTDKIRITAELTEAINLKPGDLWVLAEPDTNGPFYWEREVDRTDVGLPCLIRTNVPVDEVEGEPEKEMVYRLTVVYDKPQKQQAKMDPHNPPGFDRGDAK